MKRDKIILAVTIVMLLCNMVVLVSLMKYSSRLSDLETKTQFIKVGD